MANGMAEITLLDGAIGQELAHRGEATGNPLWSTAVMAEAPELVGQLHREYFDAGATVATTNTYPLLPDRLRGTELAGRLADLATVARDQAVAARDAHGAGRIAGALGPLGQSYRADLVWSVEDAIAAYAPLIEVLNGTVDFYLAETVASLAQGATIVQALAELTDRPLWMAFTVDDDDGTRLRSGEHVSGALEVAASAEAILLNCARPEAIGAGVPLIADAGLPVGAYANGFSHIADAFLGTRPTVDALKARDDLDPANYAKAAMDWVGSGAVVVGGCCEVGPAHIARLHDDLVAAGHTIV